ncbi:MAG: hypothetical protein A2X49_16115 [Lentisphaerae bacterium GWF2_52_8]|nr:MAG: hypothetical protein A2X49_16115 [Lentisphaerae bacterium GWF2_52_8]
MSPTNIKVFESRKAPGGWDEWAEAASRICQTNFYAEVMQEAQRSKPRFLWASKDKRILAGCLLLENSVTKKGAVANAVAGKSLSCISGPFALPEVSADDTLKAFQSLVGHVDAMGAGKFKISWGKAWIEEDSALSEDAISCIFKGLGYKKVEWANYILNLTPSEEKLLQKAERSVRKALNKCARESVRTRLVEDFDDFKKSYFPAYISAQDPQDDSAAQGTLETFRAMFDKDDKKRYRYLVAEAHDGAVFGTLGMHVCGSIATEIASSITPAAKAASIPAQDILHWNLIMMAKSLACTSFDFAGVSPAPKNAKEEGIRKFKAKWGGRYLRMLSFEKLLTRGKIATGISRLVKSMKKSADT